MGTEPDAVQQATELLKHRLAEVRGQIYALTVQADGIETAIAALEQTRQKPVSIRNPRRNAIAHGIPASSNDVASSDRPALNGAAAHVPKGYKLASGRAVRPSVRNAVKQLLDSQARALTPGEIRDLLDPRVLGHRDERQIASVIRTSLWTLREKGEAVALDGEKTISARWAQNADSPSVAAEGPSVSSGSTVRGGDQLDQLHNPRSSGDDLH